MLRVNNERDRRAFLKTTAALTGAAVLAGCRRALSPTEITPTTFLVPTATDHMHADASPSVQPSPTNPAAPDLTGRVVLVRTDDRAEGIRRALGLWDHNSVQGKALFLKPNFNSADQFPGSTHIDTLYTVVESLNSLGADHITIGDRSGMGNTHAVMQSKGVFTLADEMGLATLVFDDLSADEWEQLQPQSSHWAYGFAVPKAVLAADGIVQTCCLKTHRYGGHFTLSLKNSVGLAAKRVPGVGHDYMTELHNSAHQRRMIAEINQAYQPDLVILDGMQAFVNGGPAKGTKVTPGVIIVGADRVAIDAVGVAILRYFGTTREVSRGRVFEQEQIERAAELGIGVPNPEGIELLTGDDRSAEFAQRVSELLS